MSFIISGSDEAFQKRHLFMNWSTSTCNEKDTSLIQDLLIIGFDIGFKRHHFYLNKQIKMYPKFATFKNVIYFCIVIQYL